MPHTVTHITELFYFDELSDDAKEKARAWWREAEHEFGGIDALDMCRDDFENVAKILGITFKQNTVRTVGGKERHEPAIYYSGFWSQGDGACFEGDYERVFDAPEKIREYAPKDETLHKLADALAEFHKSFGADVTARMTHADAHYYHAYTMRVDVFMPEEPEISQEVFSAAEAQLTDLMRDFATWIYRQLESYYEFRMSDETVDETIRINEYEFLKDGTRSDG